MLFSSTTFIYLFFPTVLFLYFIVLRNHLKLQNIMLLGVSLFFYAWGEPEFVLIMILSIVVNYVFGLLIHNAQEKVKPKNAKTVLVLTVVFNLTILFIFKYLNFSVKTINDIFGSSIPVPGIALPIGISFFTFQAMSYVIDVYRGDGAVQKNVLNVGLYISFFPQLIAGPIVRYQTIAEQIYDRKVTYDDFSEGFNRFVIGLGKKVIISNSVALFADRIFDAVGKGDEFATLTYWLGVICYTLQIFYDFCGYSDMAIGMGRMFGFHFLENFDYPYISTSITEFWRRWHISLGTWFRDYIYIPLGGNRVSKPREFFNLFVVWFLTGVWHGANWTFIIWGLMYFVLLVIEKTTGFYKAEGKFKKVLLWLYSMFFVVIGWVMFRAESVGAAFDYLVGMFTMKNGAFFDEYFIASFKQIIFYVLLGVIFSFPWVKKLKEKVKPNAFTKTVYVCCILIVFILSIASITSSSYNPFIYFNF